MRRGRQTHYCTTSCTWGSNIIAAAAALQEYHVTLPQLPSQQQLQQLHAGIMIDGWQVQPKHVEVLRASPDATVAAAAEGNSLRLPQQQQRRQQQRVVLRIDVSEGKKHEVRHAALCTPIERLKSVLCALITNRAAASTSISAIAVRTVPCVWD